jgi:hypothetical protein
MPRTGDAVPTAGRPGSRANRQQCRTVGAPGQDSHRNAPTSPVHSATLGFSYAVARFASTIISTVACEGLGCAVKRCFNPVSSRSAKD